MPKRVPDATPNDYVTFPAPAGPKGRGYMPVIAGLAITKDAPNRPGNVATIQHLLKAETQVAMATELGFFPVVKAELPAKLAGGQRQRVAVARALKTRASRVPETACPSR